MFILSSANALNLDQSQNFSFGKELKDNKINYVMYRKDMQKTCDITQRLWFPLVRTENTH